MTWRHEGCCPCQNTRRLHLSLAPVLLRRFHQSSPVRAPQSAPTAVETLEHDRKCTAYKSVSEHSSVYCLLFVCSSFKRIVRIQAGEGFLCGDGPSRLHFSFLLCLHPSLYLSSIKTPDFPPHHPLCFYLLSNFASPLTYFFSPSFTFIHLHLSLSFFSLSSSLSPSPPPLSFPQRSDRSLS